MKNASKGSKAGARTMDLVIDNLKITDCKVYPVRIKANPKTKAIAKIQINEVLQLTELRVIDGVNGYFVSYPTAEKTGEDYHSVFYPLSKELREHIENVILEEYQNIVPAAKTAGGAK